MSRLIDDDWSAFRPLKSSTPLAYTWATWLIDERMTRASRAERLERWVNWLESNVPTDALLRDLEARNLKDWLKHVKNVKSDVRNFEQLRKE